MCHRSVTQPPPFLGIRVITTCITNMTIFSPITLGYSYFYFLSNGRWYSLSHSDSSSDRSENGEGFEAQHIQIHKQALHEAAIEFYNGDAIDVMDDLRPKDFLPRTVYLELPLKYPLDNPDSIHQPSTTSPPSLNQNPFSDSFPRPQSARSTPPSRTSTAHPTTPSSTTNSPTSLLMTTSVLAM